MVLDYNLQHCLEQCMNVFTDCITWHSLSASFFQHSPDSKVTDLQGLASYNSETLLLHINMTDIKYTRYNDTALPRQHIYMYNLTLSQTVSIKVEHNANANPWLLLFTIWIIRLFNCVPECVWGSLFVFFISKIVEFSTAKRYGWRCIWVLHLLAHPPRPQCDRPKKEMQCNRGIRRHLAGRSRSVKELRIFFKIQTNAGSKNVEVSQASTQHKLERSRLSESRQAVGSYYFSSLWQRMKSSADVRDVRLSMCGACKNVFHASGVSDGEITDFFEASSVPVLTSVPSRDPPCLIMV